MSYSLPVLVSDIPAKKNDLRTERYFICGDVNGVYVKMKRLISKELLEIEKHNMRRLIAEKYNWNKIAKQTIEVYEKVLKRD